MSGTCLFQHCERPQRTRNYCNGHYQQFMKGHELTPLGRRAMSPAERFWQKVDKDDMSGCWIWQGAADDRGYGQMWKSGRPRRAHRVSFELSNGPIPRGMVIDHKCRVPSCVNPGHLQAVTLGQNNENLGVVRPNNKSGARGVCWDKRRNQWAAYVGSKGARHHLGRFDNLDDAKVAVITKRLELHTNNILDRQAS